jgi:hypothetical protein
LSLFWNAFKGLPAILGVMIGIILYPRFNVWLVVIYLAIFLLSWICLTLGERIMRLNPLVGWCLIELWICSTIPITALTTRGILYLTIHSPSYFSIPDKETVAALSSALVGAVTAFFALLWTKDIAESDGDFSPQTKFKAAIQKSYKHLHPINDRKKWEAVYNDTVRGGPSGWDLSARYQRARILR